MNKIEKFLAKLGEPRRDLVLELIHKIRIGNLKDLDVKKLEGESDVFRLKKGEFRIIYSRVGDEVNIISVTRRSEKTYRDF